MTAANNIFTVFDDLSRYGFPYLGVEIHVDNKYPYITYWDANCFWIEYLLFNNSLDALVWMNDLANHECKMTVEYSLNFNIEVRW